MTDSRKRGMVMKLNMKQVCVCVPVGPVCLRGLVLAGGRQGGGVLVCVRVCVRVCVGGRVGGAGGAL